MSVLCSIQRGSFLFLLEYVDDGYGGKRMNQKLIIDGQGCSAEIVLGEDECLSPENLREIADVMENA